MNEEQKLSEVPQLVEKCLEGSREAQFELYSRYVKAMLNTSYRILNNQEDAEDVLQEAFLKAFTNLHAYRKEASFGAWLKRIVVNHAINALKKRRLKWVELDEKAGETLTLDIKPDQEEIEFTLDAAYSALHALPDGYRTVFSLYLLEGYDHKEISEILGISVSTSISQYNRAKKRIQLLITTGRKNQNGSDRKILRESA